MSRFPPEFIPLNIYIDLALNCKNKSMLPQDMTSFGQRVKHA